MDNTTYTAEKSGHTVAVNQGKVGLRQLLKAHKKSRLLSLFYLGVIMSFRKIANEDDSPFIFEWVEQWSQYFQECNWYTFNFFNFEIEDDEFMGGFNLTFILLGLGFYFRYNYEETENMKMCRDAIKDIRGRHEKEEEK